ncbi:hypothetical protein JD844_011719, partial [Phrynosoma platyrhinos]
LKHWGKEDALLKILLLCGEEKEAIKVGVGVDFWVMPERDNNEKKDKLAPCRPCSDTEVLLAVCTSDFVVRGTIQNVISEEEQKDSIIDVNVDRIYRQKTKIFKPTADSDRWQGQIKILLQCGVRPGEGDFLFTGRMHFGEARLGCAPRFRDFQRMYKEARDKGLNPCEIGPD